MKFIITINCDNAAFENREERTEELQRILKEISKRLPEERSGKVFDINGNKIGTWGFGK